MYVLCVFVRLRKSREEGVSSLFLSLSFCVFLDGIVMGRKTGETKLSIRGKSKVDGSRREVWFLISVLLLT